ncbi:adenylyltransferase/cytidyltransferase family protein [Candidatus Woesearchaeota archaeon]|nr:adenylyltransferase/cytidyltransferase family protein [Candidatus Woesearchaeota archaeon]
MAFGTFDVLHPGHLFLFSEAKKHGDRLVVVVARDKTVQKVKGHQTLHDEQKRLLAVKQSTEVDLAVLGHLDDVYKVLEEHKPNVICLGYDQHAFTDKLACELEKRKINASIVRLPPYQEHLYKSSIIKSKHASCQQDVL